MAIKPRPRSVTFFWGPNRFPQASAVAPLSQHSAGEEVACFPPGVGRSTEREMGSAVSQSECPISQSSPIFARCSLTQSTPSSSRIYAATNQPRTNCFDEKIGVVRLVWVWPMWFFFARVALSHSLVEPVTTVECTEWMAAESLLHYRPLAD